jgi:hypothetical protein
MLFEGLGEESKVLAIVAGVFFAIVMLPLPALAFGPIAHVDMGLDVITEAVGMASGTWAAIRAHQREFLRGTLGPDREVAKNLATYERHSHNWDRFFLQLENAASDAQRAFYLGCLCHLAADAVAHNYFVPMKMVESHRARFASHIYWEMRFDARTRQRGSRQALKALEMNTREHRKFLETVVPGNLLGPRFNVRMTGLAMRVQRAMAFQAVSGYVDRESRLGLADDDATDVRRLALAAQVSLMHGPSRAAVVGMDARGEETLALAGRLRRHLRDLVRRKGEPNPEAAALVADSRAHFRERLVAAAGLQA